MKIFVTGGAGFIGSNFIHYILDNYDDYIINFDKLTYAGNIKNLEDIEAEDNYQFFKGDILDKDMMKKIFLKEDIDCIVNFAAESHVDRSISDSSQFIKTNIEGTHNLLKLALDFNIKKFVQMSTDEVYGSLDDRGSFREIDILNPTNPYAASKAAADMIVNSFYKTYGVCVNICRSSNNFGPHQHPEKLIPLCIINALNSRQLPLYGDGKNIRDWIYVKDSCRAVDAVMRKGKSGEIYNIGAGSEKTNLEVAENIIEILNRNMDLIEFVEDRKAHDYRYALNTDKIRDELNWEAEHKFYSALKKTVDWYYQHVDWWE
ncbi:MULTISPECIES: dTDP-glucose 4,6-dehydratase [unclassified Halanaerobium]|uniref:dTDP-glucose 4,6-dehydratase n=1 Tax=unclassified Halanaerobium TaxID=2641197 RepID=UPI000DF47FC5|nr:MULTISPECIES: dTDP-glucose 4,6-dehydratase [unclassified Halanaerobium]RCW46331.1 dTDP-glucose 4,6-dehydratase [Halanaerobium sp. MA284_MarDTE_T2]RCW84927.1 dTDP-glucose 4,6-dehydratase [Halanaerobium sp. DL-01]